jgi:short-subunit dehydrogenase
MTQTPRPLALVTGASSGIGYELAKQCIAHGYDLVVAADEDLEQPVATFRELGATVEAAVQVDLATLEGVDQLYASVKALNRPVDVLIANAGHGLGKGFLDQSFEDVLHVINTNITGTIYLIHHVAKDMRARGAGRILLTGSIAGFMPGSFQAVYNGSKAFIDSFSFAIREELADTGVTVTCLMPGPTETRFFMRAGLLDTKMGQAKKDDPVDVAEAGFKAMLSGEGDVVSGLHNKIQTTMANVTPSGRLAKMHRSMAEPGSDQS